MQRTVRASALACAATLSVAPMLASAQILTSGSAVRQAAAPGGAGNYARPSPAPVNARSTRHAAGAPSAPPARPQAQADGQSHCLIGGGTGRVIVAVRKILEAGCLAIANLTARDKEAFADASQDAFDDPTGRARRWVAPDSKVKVTLVTTESGSESREIEFRRYSNVSPPPQGSRVVAKPFRTTAALRLRSAPDETAASNVVGSFERAEIVEVVAQTPDGRWAMVGESGVIVGYASTSWLASLDPTLTLRRTVTARARTDTAVRGSRGVAHAGLPRGTIQSAPIMASTQCKSLVATTGKNDEKKQTARACAAPGGRWIVS